MESVIKEVTKKELGPEMPEKARKFKELVEQTPVDDLEVKEYPYISFRINTNTWVEVMVTYLVEPKKAASTRTRLIKTILAELMKQPDKVLFPKSNAR